MTHFEQTQNDESLLNDMAHCSKVDSFLRMIMNPSENNQISNLAYSKEALEQYAILLVNYYRGVSGSPSLEQLPLLSHKMMVSEFMDK